MFAPLINCTHYSMQIGFSKPEEIVDKCVKNGYTACGIADYDTISGTVEFFKACKAKKIKPILGCSFFDGKLVLFARNRKGWDELILLLSSNSLENINPNNILAIAIEDLPRSVLDLFGDNLLFGDDYLKRYFYVNPEDAEIHKISSHNGKYGDKFSINNTGFHIPSKDEAIGSELIEKIVSMCEEYNILENPSLPKFPTPNGESEEEYLKQLCREGWIKKLKNTKKVDTKENEKIYLDRFLYEFGVFKKANLFGYFLIVCDILNFIKSKGWLAGPGRGSAAGCLISLLIGITKIDPIIYDLLFERFYNESRNTEDNISLPDVDIDVPSDKRDEVIEYIKSKYGQEHVGQMITLMRYQGRSALKEVLTYHEVCGFAEMNAISKHIPDEAAISDELEKMDAEERSAIRWSLINKKDDLSPFCTINEDGTLSGDYAIYFDQAIRLEGTFKTTGTHAAGIVISKKKLKEVCPVKDGIAQFEMSDLEAIGLCKIDILGVAVLSKLMYIEVLNEQRKKDLELV